MNPGSDAQSADPTHPHPAKGSAADPIVIMKGEAGSAGVGGAGLGGELAGLKILAHLLDSAVLIPGLNVRVGLDALLGVIPGLGDIGTSLMSFLILKEANRRGVSRVTMTRMTANLVIDTAMGAVPILGDAFDIYWKANERNVRLLERHAAADQRTVRRAEFNDRLFFAGLIFVVLSCLVTSLWIAFTVIRWLVGSFTSA